MPKALPESSERLIQYLLDKFQGRFSGEFYIKTHEGSIRQFKETVEPNLPMLETTVDRRP